MASKTIVVNALLNEKETLNHIIDTARKRIREIDDEERRQTNKDMVDRFFVYKNRYSSGDEWNLYQAITAMDEDGNLTGWQFQTDCDGKQEAESGRIFHASILGREITKPQFVQAWKEFVENVKKFAE